MRDWCSEWFKWKMFWWRSCVYRFKRGLARSVGIHSSPVVFVILIIFCNWSEPGAILHEVDGSVSFDRTGCVVDIYGPCHTLLFTTNPNWLTVALKQCSIFLCTVLVQRFGFLFGESGIIGKYKVHMLRMWKWIVLFGAGEERFSFVLKLPTSMESGIFKGVERAKGSCRS